MTVHAASAPESVAELDFEVIGSQVVRHAAVPMLSLELQVSESAGRSVYMVGLRIQLMIEPARRSYDEDTRARLVELFGPPERWGVTTRSLVWSQIDLFVPAFTGSTVVSAPIVCHGDMELAATRYLNALPDGEAPLALHFNGTIYYPDENRGLQMVLVPWNRSIDFRMPVAVWRETMEHYYPHTGWISINQRTLEALGAEKRRRGLSTLDDCVCALLRDANALEERT